MNTPPPPVSANASRRAYLLAVIGLALALAITLPPLSSTRLQTWPFAFATAAFWLLPTLVALVRLALGRPDARFGGLLDLAFAALAAAGLAATLASPLRATLAPQLLPFLGAISLPYALLPLFRERREAGLSAAFIFPLILVAAILWQLAPADFSSPHIRNNQPFGHANTTGSVFAVAACWLGCLAWRAGTRAARLAYGGGAMLCAVHVVTSGSRGAMIALGGALAVGCGLVLLRRGRVVAFLVVCSLIAAAALAANARLREVVLGGGWSRADQGSNVERIAMLRGGFALFAERPALGWGPGALPHVFPGVRASLPGTPDNYLQLHNTPVQLAATLGLAGIFGASLLLIALFLRARNPVQAPFAAALVCAGLVLLFDHPFATPAFALLVALPIAALGAAPRVRPAAARGWSALPALGLLFILPAVVRDLAARAAWSDALDAAAREEPVAYVGALRRAGALAPADPFYTDQLVSHLATGHPFAGLRAPDPAAAIPLLRAELGRNPRHEFAHYNLGWLLLAGAPGEAAEARDHFAAAARLAPMRREVYLGLALARIKTGEGESAVSALAAEILLDPAFAWSPRWRETAIALHRNDALSRAADFLVERDRAPLLATWLRSAGAPVDALLAYRRVRTGHGVLYGHPDGPPPTDVNVLLRLQPPRGAEDAFPRPGTITPAELLSCAELAP